MTFELAWFVGIVAGLLWGALGYAVARSKTGADFDPTNFGTTVAIGFVLGLLANVAGTDVTTIEGYSVLQLVTIIVDKLVGFLKKPK